MWIALSPHIGLPNSNVSSIIASSRLLQSLKACNLPFYGETVKGRLKGFFSQLLQNHFSYAQKCALIFISFITFQIYVLSLKICSGYCRFPFLFLSLVSNYLGVVLRTTVSKVNKVHKKRNKTFIGRSHYANIFFLFRLTNVMDSKAT